MEEQYRTRYELAQTSEIRDDVFLEIIDHAFDEAVTWPWFQDECMRRFNASPEAVKQSWPILRKQQERADEMRIALQASEPIVTALHNLSRGLESKQAAKKKRDEPKGFDGLGQKKSNLSQYLDIPGLSNRQRDCLSMRLEYELPTAEIARRLDLHRKTVDEHIAAGEKRLNRNRQRQQGAKRRAVRPGSQDD